MTPEAMADRRLRRLRARVEQAPAVGWRQLCAIAQAERQPGIDEGEWAARVKTRVVRLGFELDPFAAARAMRAVERVHGKIAPAAVPRELPKPTPARASLSKDDSIAFLAAIRAAAARRSA